MTGCDAIFEAKRVVVFGSMSPGKIGAALVERIVGAGLNPKCVFAVNPKGMGLGEVAGYTSVLDIAGGVELAVIASPASTVPEIMEDCGKANIYGAVIISSGFSEAGNDDIEHRVCEIANKYGIRFVGPNCAGVANTEIPLMATIEATPKRGRVGLISQSGAVGGMIMHMSNKFGLGIGKFASYGNGADLSETELLEHFGGDSNMSVIAMYVENIAEGRRFMETLRKVAAKKPVVIIKSGRTATGQRAAMSHTGSMAGADVVYDAAFDACGAVRVESVDEMFDVCKMFDNFETMKGRRVAIITNSGGPGVMTADKCEAVGLVANAPSSEMHDKLRQILPPHAGISNPIDLTVEGTESEYAKALDVVFDEYDAAIVIYVGVEYMEVTKVAEAVCEIRAKHNKPVAAFFEIGTDIEAAKELLSKTGIPVYESGERAACALHALCKYYERKNAKRECRELFPHAATGRIHSQYGSLLEPQAMKLLRLEGLPVPQFKLANSVENVLVCAEEIGYPVCMKVVSPDILHKSDAGGVILNVKGEQAVKDAYYNLEKAAAGKVFCGVIVYPMLKPGREVIMGLTRDRQFGPVVVFGMGGVYTEVFRDIVTRIAPLSKQDADDMISSVASYQILRGARGERSVDLDMLSDMLVKLSELPFKYPQIKEMDLNPVFAYEEGASIADARIILDMDI